MHFSDQNFIFAAQFTSILGVYGDLAMNSQISMQHWSEPFLLLRFGIIKYTEGAFAFFGPKFYFRRLVYINFGGLQGFSHEFQTINAALAVIFSITSFW